MFIYQCDTCDEIIVDPDSICLCTSERMFRKLEWEFLNKKYEPRNEIGIHFKLNINARIR